MKFELSPEFHQQLSNAATRVFKPTGTILFRAGEPGEGTFVIRSGEVRLSSGDNPLSYPSRVLGVGNVIGLPATFSGEPYSLTAEAVADCDLDFIPRPALLNLLRHNPELGFQIARILSEEIFEMRHVNAESEILVPDWTAQ